MNTFNTPAWESSVIGNKSAKQLLSLPVNRAFKKQNKLKRKKNNLTNTEGTNRKNAKPKVKIEKFSLCTSIKQTKLKKKKETACKDNFTKMEGINKNDKNSKRKNKNISFHTSINSTNKSFSKKQNVTKNYVKNDSLIFKERSGKVSSVKRGDQDNGGISGKKVIQKINKKKMARLRKRNKPNKSYMEVNTSDCMQNETKCGDQGNKGAISDKKIIQKINKKKIAMLKKRNKKYKSDMEVNTSYCIQIEANQNKDKIKKTHSEKRTLRLNDTENKKSKLIALLRSAPVLEKKKKSLTLKERMIEKLKTSRFRYINEQIYNSEGKEAHTFFRSDPDAFYTYHEGYRQQVLKWPLNPLDVIIKSIKKMPADYVIADFGCGEANLAKSVSQHVHSFDLVSINEYVTACDMSHVPLENDSVDVVVFCLSLMGTNIREYLYEANRVLKTGGKLKIAEVESRFDTIDLFIEGVKRFGFKNTWKDLSHNLFYFIDFEKISKCKSLSKLPTIGLHPCLYKKR